MTTAGSIETAIIGADTVGADEATAELVPHWRALAEECGAGPFPRPDFALGWWRHLGRGRLLLVTVRRDGMLVALAGLHERSYGPLRVARWLGHGLGSVSEVLVRPGHEDADAHVWSALQDGRRVLQLVEYRRGGGGLRALGGDPHWHTRVEAHDVCPVIDLRGGGAAGHLEQPGRRNIRRTVRAARRHLADAGLTHTVETVCDSARWLQVLPEVTAVYDAAERSRPRLHLLRPPWRGFVISFLEAALVREEAVVFVGRLDQRAISFDIVLRTGTTMHSWIGRFDPAARRFSPGHLLQYVGIDWAGEHNVARIDLLLGDAAYKRQWATDAYGTLSVTSCRPLARTLASPALQVIEAASLLKHRIEARHVGRHRR